MSSRIQRQLFNSPDKLQGDKGHDLFFATLGGSDQDKVQDNKSDEVLLELINWP